VPTLLTHQGPMAKTEPDARGPSKPRHYSFVTGVVAFAYLYFVPYLVPDRAAASDFGGGVLLLWLLFLLWLFPVVALHEVGHALAARSVGFRIAWVHIGPFVIARKQMRQFRKWVQTPKEFLGSVVAFPLNGLDLERRALPFYAGGPLASAVVFICLAFAVYYMGNTAGTTAQYIVRGAFLSSAWILIPNLLLVSSDSQGIIEILRGRFDPRPLASLGIAAASISGVRPRDWEPSLLLPLGGSSGTTDLDAGPYLLMYYRAFDCGKLEDAGRHLDKALSCDVSGTPRLENTIRNEAAYFEAAVRDNLEAARALQAAVVPELVTPDELLRTKAAIARSEGHEEEARSLETQAKNLLRVNYNKGWSAAASDMLNCRPRIAE
jgi:hypothetical protein